MCGPSCLRAKSFLGVRPSQEYIFCVIACRWVRISRAATRLLKLWVSDQYTRAAPGGTGAAKCGGNYASSLIAQAEATKHGCDQVVFLDAVEHRWVEELGGMNLFFVMNDGSLITPPLTGTILPGITRTSIIDIARSLGMQVKEAPYSLDQWRTDAQTGRLSEAFACGTAAVVASIGEIASSTGSFRFGNGVSGPVSQKLKAQLIGIQRGTVEDSRGWVQGL